MWARTSIEFGLGLALVPLLVYVFYAHLRPTVIFGLRSDYAHAIPYIKKRRLGSIIELYDNRLLPLAVGIMRSATRCRRRPR